ncbi:MAG: hypothetical protein K8R39_02185 [Arcobacteraceae bacterium]|nr:hypothetical protein [Arcobacteraceae bacterium]
MTDKIKKLIGYVILIIGLYLSIYYKGDEWSGIFIFLGIILITNNFEVLRNAKKRR